MRITKTLIGAVLVSAFLAGCTTASESAEISPTSEAHDVPEFVIRTEVPEIRISTEAPTAEPSALPTQSATPSPTAEQSATETVEQSAPLLLLEEIPVKGRAPKTGYDRGLFGSGWADPDRNGCDARNDILARDLTVHSYKAGTHDCVVLTGTLEDPYTRKTIEFERGQGTSNAVQIDHIVALSDAWQKGAQQLSATERVNLANDPINLVAVDGPTNASKGDGDAATWLPPNRDHWCEYVKAQVTVKYKYDLWMTEAEHQRSNEVLASYC